jgi:selenocysteine-specific elongation factor
MRVIGTAGHVDHGKSTLVQALTGIHPDRLKEEREREMTIDLGFAWLKLPGGEDVGVVDVPGHRDFIENMLAGVGGIDAALFVVAADEGIMPQTREHLAILDILQVPGGVVALTKIDLVDDADWLDLVEEDVRSYLAGSVLGEAPIVRVSARTRQGLPDLLQALHSCLAERPPRPDLGRPRLPVDRVFTMSGFGTVVTGTLIDGSLRSGDEIEILPAGLRGRVRGLQTHKQKEEMAVPGSRTAVNISGVNIEQVLRGYVVAHPGDYQPSRRIDVQFRLLPDVSQVVEHNTRVKLFLGAAEVQARLRLLGSEQLDPGEDGWLQLELEQPLVAVRGDRYILRRPSPGETLGGGMVIDPHPKGRHKRFGSDLMARLKALAQGEPEDILLQALLSLGTASLTEVIERSHLDEGIARRAVHSLFEAGTLVALENSVSSESLSPNSLVTSLGAWNGLSARAVQEVTAYHRNYPLRRGLPREELKSRLKMPPGPSGARLFTAVLRKLVSGNLLEEAGPLVLLPGHTIRFNPQQKRQVDQLLARFAAAPYAPPSVKECQADVGEDLLAALVELGDLIPLSAEVIFRRVDYEKMVADIRHLLQNRGTLTAAEARDHFNTSRRYILALLEHLDAIGITQRDGDLRRLKMNSLR